LKKTLRKIFNVVLKKLLIIYFYQSIRNKEKFFSQVLKNKIISSKLFIFISDVHSLDLRSSSKIYLVSNKKFFFNRKIFYVCSDSLEDFYENYINLIENDFVLITGDSDRSISNDNEIVKKISNHKNLKFWFAQNLVEENKLMKRIPIGLDFISAFHDPHMISFKIRNNATDPYLHGQLLNNIIKNSFEISQRENLIYCNYHFFLDRGNRKECFESTNRNLCYFLKNRTNFLDNYKLQSKFKFVLSPSGSGLDCHRTWESLVLGNIPIVKSSCLDNIYNGLPVLIVKNWSDITIKLLENFYNDYITREYNFEKLTTDYWVKLIRNENNYNFRIKNYSLFKKYLNA
jgi:hypothetical protein